MQETEIRWEKAEWSDDPQVQEAYHEGLVGSVEPPAESGKWFWAVKVTAEVSEWPELVASGENRTEEAAKKQAEQRLRKYGKQYSKIEYV